MSNRAGKLSNHRPRLAEALTYLANDLNGVLGLAGAPRGHLPHRTDRAGTEAECRPGRPTPGNR